MYPSAPCRAPRSPMCRGPTSSSSPVVAEHHPRDERSGGSRLRRHDRCVGRAGDIGVYRLTDPGCRWTARGAAGEHQLVLLRGAQPIRCPIPPRTLGARREHHHVGGVSAGIDMALYLTAQLTDEPAARRVQLALDYDPGHRSAASTGSTYLPCPVCCAAGSRSLVPYWHERRSGSSGQWRRRWHEGARRGLGRDSD